MKSAPSKAKPKRSYHHGALREAIVAASLASIAEHGIAGLSLREAARRAGVSPAAPYFHWKNRQELLDAIGHEGFAAMGEAMLAALAEVGDDPFDRLAALGRAYIRFALARPQHFAVMFQACQQPEPGITWQLLVETVAAVAAARGEPARAPALTVLAWSSVHGAATLLLQGGIHFDGKKPLSAAEVETLVTETFRELLTKKRR